METQTKAVTKGPYSSRPNNDQGMDEKSPREQGETRAQLKPLVQSRP